MRPPPQHLLNDSGGSDMTAVAEESATDDHSDGTGRRFSLNGGVRGVVLTSLLLLLIYASAQSDQLGRLYSVSWKIVLVVGTSAAVFIGANLLISQGRQNWARYRALAGGLLGATGFGLLRGNRSISTLVADSEFIFTRDDSEPFVVVDPAQIDAIGKVAELRPGLAEYATGDFAVPAHSVATGRTRARSRRRLRNRPRQPDHPSRVPTAVGAFAGWLIGTSLLFRNRPDASIVEIVLFAIVGAAILAGISLLFGKRHVLVERALFGAAIGATVGGWLLPGLGSGSGSTAIIAAVIRLRCSVCDSAGRATALRMGSPHSTGGACGDLPRPALTFLSINLSGAGGPHHPHLVPRPRQ